MAYLGMAHDSSVYPYFPLLGVSLTIHNTEHIEAFSIITKYSIAYTEHIKHTFYIFNCSSMFELELYFLRTFISLAIETSQSRSFARKAHHNFSHSFLFILSLSLFGRFSSIAMLTVQFVFAQPYPIKRYNKYKCAQHTTNEFSKANRKRNIKRTVYFMNVEGGGFSIFVVVIIIITIKQ